MNKLDIFLNNYKHLMWYIYTISTVNLCMEIFINLCRWYVQCINDSDLNFYYRLTKTKIPQIIVKNLLNKIDNKY